MPTKTILQTSDVASGVASSDYRLSTGKRGDQTSRHGHGRAEDDTDREVRNEQDALKRDENAVSEKQRNDDQDDDGQKDNQENRRSRWPLIILAIVTVAAIIGGIVYWLATRDLEDTDDAYTEGNAVSIAPKVSGYVVERRVDDNTLVKSGDLLIRIDPRDYIAARDQAQANLHLAEAQLASAKINLEIVRVSAPAHLVQAQSQLQQARASQANAARSYERQHSVDPRATTQTNTDQANAQLRSTNASVSSSQAQVQTAGLVTQNIQAAGETVKQEEAHVAQIQAALTQAELNLSYTEIRASQDGYITQRNVGTYAQAGQQILSRDDGLLDRRELQGNPADGHASRPSRQDRR